MTKVEWIDSNRALEGLCRHLSAQEFVAVDTEFHRERSFFARLALVQVASEERVACIDPLGDLDLGPLEELMSSPKVIKVMHASRQDLEIFFERTGFIPEPLFDTQIAAGLLGLGDQISYGALVRKLTKKQLKKIHGLTNWLGRPLSPEVLEYAADDVLHLPPVYKSLERELRQKGRRQWLDEEQAYLLSSATYIVRDEDAWLKVKGTGTLRGVECAIAERLAGWRERLARKLDRPRKHILSDHVLVDIARLQPSTTAELGSSRMLDAGIRRRHGAALLDMVRDAKNADKNSWPAPRDRRAMDRYDDAVVHALSAVLQRCAENTQISASLLATKGQLQRLASGDRDVAAMRGWRAELVGNEFRSFLDGESQLAVERGRVKIVSNIESAKSS